MPVPRTTDWLLFQTADTIPVVNGIDWVNPENALSAGDGDYASLPTPNNAVVTPSDIIRLINPAIVGLPDNCAISAMRFRIRIQGINDTFGNPPNSLVQVVIGGDGVGDNLHYPLVGSGIVNGEYESELTPVRSEIDANFGIQRRVQSNNVGGEYRIYTAWVQFDFVAATGDGTFPGLSGSGQGKSIGSGSAVLPGLTGKAHHRVN